MKKQKYNLYFWGLVAIFSLIIVSVSLVESGIQVFELRSAGDPRLDDVINNNGGSENTGGEKVSEVGLPNVKCFIKTSLKVLDENGNVIESAESTFLVERPKAPFNLLKTDDGKTIDELKITPKLKCQIDDDVPMTVSNVQLKALIFGKNENNQKIEVWNDNKMKNGIKVTPHDSELVTFTAKAVDIFKFLPEGTYDSDLEIKVRGVIDISYDAFPSVNYEVIVPEESIKTFLDVQVTDNPSPQDEPKGSGGGNETPLDNSGNNNIVDVEGLDELFSCATSFDIACMMQQQFLPFYLLGIGGIFILGSLGTRNNPPAYDQFGNVVR